MFSSYLFTTEAIDKGRQKGREAIYEQTPKKVVAYKIFILNFVEKHISFSFVVPCSLWFLQGNHLVYRMYVFFPMLAFFHSSATLFTPFYIILSKRPMSLRITFCTIRTGRIASMELKLN